MTEQLSQKTIDEIIPQLMPHMKKSWFYIGKKIVGHELKKGFSDIEIGGLENIAGFPGIENAWKEKEQDKMYVFISRHLSEVDWVLTQYALADNGRYTTIHAGNNLLRGKWKNILKNLGASTAVRIPEIFKLKDGQEITVTKEMYEDRELGISEGHLKTILKSHPYLLYPEYKRIGPKEYKTGRSYTEEYLPFAPPFFRTLPKLQSESGKVAVLCPIGISYERKYEDSNIMKQQEINDPDEKLEQDFEYIINKVKSGKYKRDASIIFGETFTLDSNMKSRSQVDLVRGKVGELSRIHSPHVVFTAINDYKQGTNYCIQLDVLAKMVYNLQSDISNLENALGRTLCSERLRSYKTPEQLIERTAIVYNELVEIKKIKNSNYVVIHGEKDKGEISQSINQAKHLFERKN